jgi:large subunit ribosomal protein L20
MARVKTGPTRRRRHKKIIKMAKGYRMTRHKLVKRAKEAVIRAGQHAYIGRKLRKRDMRRLWIQRINAGLTEHGLSYGKFINGLKKAKIELNRKILADLATTNPRIFKLVVDKAKKS